MRIQFGIVLAILLNLSSNAWADTLRTTFSAEPAVGIEPGEVIQIVVDALRSNDSDSGDEGIALVWRFAAPSNKAITGPLPRFSQMIKRGFPNMLNHVASDYGPIRIEEDLAAQPVWLLTPSGDEVGYLFQLRKQTSGEYEGMWMTESVYPLAPRRSGRSI